MVVVTAQDEIIENLRLFEDYLCEGTDDEQLYCSDLIRKGKCLIAYKVGQELRFAPSRYIGYTNNSIQSHSEDAGDGRDTTPAISKLLGKLVENSDLDQKYIEYCESLGSTPYNKKRKFWTLDLEESDFKSHETSSEGFPEGKIVERRHLARERNSALISQAKEHFKRKNKRLFCEACNFDFEKAYGQRGFNFIEAHHTIPVSEMLPAQKTKISDIAMVCSNCHRILHRSRPWLTIAQLKNLISNET
ncbi:HNH endonuclease [Pseudomonas luteola]|uniref:HNH endonuclease n=1 Tax=Pseudomonas TaxID=286 RepID=UPI00123A2A2A|nr:MULTISPECIES: HNH endonuclease [Pseudomonas]MBA1245968.1 HNH endonuclease [Pseudomonas zeshuii]QEU27397.1 HNH endonuclease [Pseudomonas luteola]